MNLPIVHCWLFLDTPYNFGSSFFLSLPFIADRSFSNVNGRASEEDIEDLEDLVKNLMANLTSFETTIIG